jgi:Fic family protein
LLTNKSILQIQEVLEDNKAGFRKLPGTALKNAATGETIYTPPQDYEEIMKLMANLEKYINDSELQDCDPLIKMAIIHFQFESIHPFYDGNGRTGQNHKYSIPDFRKIADFANSVFKQLYHKT